MEEVKEAEESEEAGGQRLQPGEMGRGAEEQQEEES